MEAYSLYEVNEYIRRVIALNFDEPIWVESEINQISQTRGNSYLELIEKDPDTDDIIAKSSATLWFRQRAFIQKKLGKLADEVLSAGVKVKLKCTVEFSERYGLSLNVLDIDPAYTFGQHELNRQKIIERLQKSGLIGLNAEKELPRVIKNIAVISSSTAAGYKDFTQQVYHSNYGYSFHMELFQSAMQGQNTERDILMALDSIDTNTFDTVCIIRGGGSKLDLSAFDNYPMAERIAKFPIPVLTGIGHEIDQSICDIVAHSTLKTPTAVAQFILEHNWVFESEMEYMLEAIVDKSKDLLNDRRHRLASIKSKLTSAPTVIINQTRSELLYLEKSAISEAVQLIQKRTRLLESIEGMIELVDPSNILRRGFTLVKGQDGYILRREHLDENEEISIEFYDGEWKIK